MNSTIRSNKSIMIDKSKRFRKTLGGFGKNRKIDYDFPNATPEQLKAIRHKLKRENQILWIQFIIFSVIVAIGVVWWLFLS